MQSLLTLCILGGLALFGPVRVQAEAGYAITGTVYTVESTGAKSMVAGATVRLTVPHCPRRRPPVQPARTALGRSPEYLPDRCDGPRSERLEDRDVGFPPDPGRPDRTDSKRR